MAAKRKTTTTTTAAETTTAAAVEPTKTKSELVRTWFKSNPDKSATEAQKAMKELHDIEVGSSHCQQVKNKMFSASNVEDARKAAVEFAKQYEDIDEAISAIQDVGEFITAAGGTKKAVEALEFVKQALEFAESMKS